MTTPAMNYEIIPKSESHLYIQNPQFSFFNGNPPKRHSPFCKSPITLLFNNNPAYGGVTSTTVGNTTDLMAEAYLEWSIPEMQLKVIPGSGFTGTANARFCLANNFGHAAINWIEVAIGPNRIDRHYGTWLQIWTQLTTPAGNTVNDKLVGSYNKEDPSSIIFSPEGILVSYPEPSPSTSYQNPLSNNGVYGVISARTIRVPLKFWFCKESALALPLVALQTPVTINVQFNPVSQLGVLILEKSAPTDTVTAQVTTGVNSALASVTLSPASPTTGLLYISTQLSNLPMTNLRYVYQGISIGTAEKRRTLTIPCEHLIETLQYSPKTTILSRNVSIDVHFTGHIKELFWVVSTTSATKDVLGVNLFGRHGLYIKNNFITGAAVNGLNMSTSLTTLRSKISSGDVGIHPVQSCAIQFDGADRVPASDAEFYSSVQLNENHVGKLSPGVYVYSFALQPEDCYQHSGQVNFNAFRTLTFKLSMHPSLFDNHPTESYHFQCYALSVNFLRIIKGQGGLAYASS